MKKPKKVYFRTTVYSGSEEPADQTVLVYRSNPEVSSAAALREYIFRQYPNATYYSLEAVDRRDYKSFQRERAMGELTNTMLRYMIEKNNLEERLTEA